MVHYPDVEDSPRPDAAELADLLGIEESALKNLTYVYVEAFVEGAVAAWEEIKDQI